MSYTQNQLASILGKVILFCGTETSTFTPGQWANVAAFCRAHGVDTVLVKIADGGAWWYGGPVTISEIRSAFLAAGVGFIPYGYFYGNKYDAITTEIGIVRYALNTWGFMCMDLEVELNGDTTDAHTYASELGNHVGILLCSTWGDPQLQNWQGVLDILTTTFDAFMPQEYTLYLDSTEYQLAQAGIRNMVPTIYLGALSGNDPYQVAVDIHNRGHVSISLWYDGFAIEDPSLVDKVVALYRNVPAPAPVPVPQPVKASVFMEQQFKDVWNDNQWGLPMNTGIAETVLQAFLEKKCTACFPTSHELDTVDWSGNKIKFQTFSNGLHAEYNIAQTHCRLYNAEGVEIV